MKSSQLQYMNIAMDFKITKSCNKSTSFSNQLQTMINFHSYRKNTNKQPIYSQNNIIMYIYSECTITQTQNNKKNLKDFRTM